MRQGRKTYFAAGTVALLVLAGAGLWLGREPLLAWYYLRKLAASDGDEARRWAERAASLDEQVVPDLVRLLGSGEPRVCANARTALDCLGQRWGRDDGPGQQHQPQGPEEHPLRAERRASHVQVPVPGSTGLPKGGRLL